MQVEHLGWHTDDLLVVGRAGTDAERRLLCQVKRTFRISATDEDCRKAFGDFWADFCNRTLFRRGEDQFAIITSRGTNRLLSDLCGLLDTARAARDAADFAHRMSIQGVVSDAVRRDCGQIRTLLDEANATPVSDDDFVLFLKHLHLISYDLNTSTSQTEAWIKTLLAHTASGHDKVAVAAHTWSALLQLVASGMPHAASHLRVALPGALLASHTPVGSSDHDALWALRQHGIPVFQNIRTIIGGDCHLPRDEVETRFLTTLAQHRVVVIAGPAGSGKSAVAKNAIQRLADGCLTFAFRAEEFAHPHLDQSTAGKPDPPEHHSTHRDPRWAGTQGTPHRERGATPGGLGTRRVLRSSEPHPRRYQLVGGSDLPRLLARRGTVVILAEHRPAPRHRRRAIAVRSRDRLRDRGGANSGSPRQ